MSVEPSLPPSGSANGPIILGQMQTKPLLISQLIDYAAVYHGETEIVSRSVEGPVHRTNYRQVNERAKALAIALQTEFGVKPGDRVATIAWNTWRHLELYYGVSGFGAVIHTVNPRLFVPQIEYILNHGGASVLFFDLTFAPIVEKLKDSLPNIKHFVLMTDQSKLPASLTVPADRLFAYESILSEVPSAKVAEFRWPSFNENSASALCYTSGTTGNPKGVLYSHRSAVLHAWAVAAPDAFCLKASDCGLVIVPLFHASAWGMPYCGAQVGIKLVLPGPALDGRSLSDLIINEKVTLTAGVPSVMQGLVQFVEDNEIPITTLNRVVVGGSAIPRDLLLRMNNKLHCSVIHAWGMTETSPLGTIGTFLPKHAELDEEARLALNLKQGRVPFGVELKITDDQDRELPRDGKAFGDLKIRGPWVVQSYFKEEKQAIDADGWFSTGDVATLDPDGFMNITDRSKDVIKSGGEWISSIEIENLAVGHPAVSQAAVIGARHLKWQERPLLLVVLKKDATASREDVLAFLKPKVVSWWMPDDVVFVNELPFTATGKLNKLKLRELYGERLITHPPPPKAETPMGKALTGQNNF